jgi:hypothetical protein
MRNRGFFASPRRPVANNYAYDPSMISTLRLLQTAFFAAFPALLLTASSLQAADRLQPGQWEFTLTTDGSSHTAAHCVTAVDASEVNGDTKSGREAAEKKASGRCTVQSYGVEGDTVSYSLSCGNRTIDSTTTFHGDTSDGSLTTTVQGAKAVVTHVKARRLGACTPAS